MGDMVVIVFQKYNRHNLFKAFYDLTLLISLWCCLTCLELRSPDVVATFPWICHLYLPLILFIRSSLSLKYFLSHPPTLPTFPGQLLLHVFPSCWSLLKIWVVFLFLSFPCHPTECLEHDKYVNIYWMSGSLFQSRDLLISKFTMYVIPWD